MRVCTYLTPLFHYKPIQRIAERLYSIKFNQSCFLIKQNRDWTVVTVTRY